MKKWTSLLILALFLGLTTVVSGCPADDDDDSATDDDDATPNFEGDEPGECDDGADNDQDGAFDCEDEDCWGSTDCEDEEPPGGCAEAGGRNRGRNLVSGLHPVARLGMLLAVVGGLTLRRRGNA